MEARYSIGLWEVEMKKHTNRISEMEFSKTLEEGDVFAISGTTYVPSIHLLLETRELRTEPFFKKDWPIDKRREWNRHWGIRKVVRWEP